MSSNVCMNGRTAGMCRCRPRSASCRICCSTTSSCSTSATKSWNASGDSWRSSANCRTSSPSTRSVSHSLNCLVSSLSARDCDVGALRNSADETSREDLVEPCFFLRMTWHVFACLVKRNKWRVRESTGQTRITQLKVVYVCFFTRITGK